MTRPFHALSYSNYDAPEDRWIKLALKLLLLVAVLVAEVIVFGALAIVMWHAVN